MAPNSIILDTQHKDGVRICVRNVDADTWNNFRTYLIREYGGVKGVIGEVLSRAIDNWLHDDVRSNIITNSKVRRLRRDVRETCDKISAMLETMGPETTQPAFCELMKTIGYEDERSWTRYLKEMLDRKRLAYKATSSSGVIIYRINHEHYATLDGLIQA